MSEAISKKGRKRINAAEAPRPVLSFRIRADLDAKLRAAAEKNSLALSEEVEGRLFRSIESDDLQAEMRGTIAALEQRIALMEEGDRRLWPDEAARELGKSFAMTLIAVQHMTGHGWRESPTAPAIVSAVVRRAMEGCGRGRSLYAELADRKHIEATTDNIAGFMVDGLRAKLPPLDEPEADFSLWTHRARTVVVFRDKASGENLKTVRGPEYDVTDPEDRPPLGPEYRAALDRFRPIRDTVEAETFTAYSMKNGSAVWDSLSEPGKRIVMRPVTAEEFARDFKPASGQDPSIFDRALWDEINGPERPDDEPPPPAEPPVAPKRRGRAKAEV